MSKVDEIFEIVNQKKRYISYDKINEIYLSVKCVKINSYKILKKSERLLEFTNLRIKLEEVYQENLIIEKYNNGENIEKISGFSRKISKSKVIDILQSLIDNQKISKRKCENCNEPIKIVFASGRFCSIGCSKSYATKQISETSREKQIHAITSKSSIEKSQKTSHNKRLNNPELYVGASKLSPGESADNRKMRISESMKSYYKENPEAILNIKKIHSKKKVSIETRKKLSDISLKKVKDGTHSGWKSRLSIEPSYPEKVWRQVLNNNGIEYKREFPINKKRDLLTENCSNYFLDFMIISHSGKVVDLEIDGKQHNYPERILSDKKRDNLLYSIGILVYRIPWINPNNEENKQVFSKQIENFILFLKLN